MSVNEYLSCFKTVITICSHHLLYAVTQECSELLDKLEDKNGDMASMYEYYLKYIDFYEMWRSEALRLTE